MLLDYIKKYQIGTFKENLELKNLTTLKIGGRCLLYIEVESINKLKKLLKFLKKEKILYFIIGNGSNLLIDDDYINAVFISLKKINKIKRLSNNTYILEAGCKPQVLGKTLIEQGFIEAIPFVLIPGTIGGMIYMNASCFKRSIYQSLRKVICLNKDQEIITIDYLNQESYRSSIFQDNHLIVLMGIFTFKEVKINAVEKLLKYQEIKRTTQPIIEKSAGSMFKNTNETFAWKLIDEVNLRGFNINDSEISLIHTNFFINKKNAKFKEMLALIYYTKALIYQKFNVFLETEVKIITTESIAYSFK